LDVTDADTVNVTKKNGTAPAMASALRLIDDGAGALPGAVADEVVVIVVPAGTPAATATLAAWPFAAAGIDSVPPPVGSV
jgi:hypothetical protein